MAETLVERAGTVRRVLLVGATGTIGHATAQALQRRGIETICLVRAGASSQHVPPGSRREIDLGDDHAVIRDGIRGESFDAIVSCVASRTGVPRDAWAVDYEVNRRLLDAAEASDIPRFVMLSAICVQKPVLGFQHAKLAFEQRLMDSTRTWSIVRPTAFFKSLSGQAERVRRGKPFLVFGNGELTSCKPISDDDVAEFLVDCLHDPRLAGRVLPVGGPGEAMTPLQQGALLFAAFGKQPRHRHVPLALLDVIIGVLSTLGRVVPALADKAELARIGRYYATESMLCWDPVAVRYDADATPSVGRDTLADHYAHLASGTRSAGLGQHAVFD